MIPPAADMPVHRVGKVPHANIITAPQQASVKDLLMCAIAGPVSWYHLGGVPEHSVGVSKKGHQMPIGILTSC